MPPSTGDVLEARDDDETRDEDARLELSTTLLDEDSATDVLEAMTLDEDSSLLDIAADDEDGSALLDGGSLEEEPALLEGSALLEDSVDEEGSALLDEDSSEDELEAALLEEDSSEDELEPALLDDDSSDDEPALDEDDDAVPFAGWPDSSVGNDQSKPVKRYVFVPQLEPNCAMKNWYSTGRARKAVGTPPVNVSHW